MTPHKILFVDDEVLALKYFDRLVSPLAPVITASSVEQGKAVLRERGDEIAVLVSDQRMPGAHGNELLGYAREFHPSVVRMLTTAYSELGQAIEAINSGEIYRYITKPWDLGTLHADLRNALELAELRNQRDSLVREKLIVQQQQVLGTRLAMLSLLTSTCTSSLPESEAALARFADAAIAAGVTPPDLSAQPPDFSALLQAEARRHAAIGHGVKTWLADFGPATTSAAEAMGTLSRAIGGRTGSDGLQVPWQALTGLLTGHSDRPPLAAETAWLAWLLWWNAPVDLLQSDNTWMLNVSADPQPAGARSAPPSDWLEQAIDRLLER
ncbi:MAG: response regulator [Pseudomonadota bacterium]